MLRIIVNDQQVDIMPDTSITLTWENPFMSPDRVPTPYSLDFDLPPTVNNADILGYPHNVTSDVVFSQELPCSIYHSGILVATGHLTIEEVSAEAVNVSFNSIVFADTMRRHLQNQPFGGLSLPDGHIVYSALPDTTGGVMMTSRLETRTAQWVWNNKLVDNIALDAPDFVAAPMAIEGAEWVEAQEQPASAYLNQNASFINSFDNQYMMPAVGVFAEHISKVIPALRVGYMLRKMLPNLENNIFDSGDFARLMLVLTWHPSYQQDDDAPAWTASRKTLQVELNLADFCPNVPANEFLCQMLKLPCASIYVVGGRFVIERNIDTLARACTMSWDDKVIGELSISRQSGQDYIVGYSSESTPASVETPTLEFYDLHGGMIAGLRTAFEGANMWNITTTGQVVEIMPDTHYVSADGQLSGYRFKLIEQNMGGSKASEDSKRGSFDMTFQGGAVRTMLAPVLKHDTDPPAFASGVPKQRYYYCPLVAKPEATRPDSLLVGIYHGLQRVVSWGDNSLFYPFIGHCNYNATGSRLGDFSLQWHGNDGLMARNHAAFKQWVEKDKRVLKADVLLNALDLHNLDLRDKVHLEGCNFFISELSVTLTANSVDPAQVELVEA